MFPTTHAAIRSILAADPSVTPSDRIRILTQMQNHKKTLESMTTESRIIRRAEAARRLGCSLRTIDNLACCGALNRIRLPGRIRACGFRLSEIEALIAGTHAATKVVIQHRGRELTDRTIPEPRKD